MSFGRLEFSAGDDPWPGVAFVDGVQLPSAEPGPGVRRL